MMAEQHNEPRFTNRQKNYQRFIKAIALILGFLTTYFVFILLYGDRAFTQLLKGISFQNLITIVTDLNYDEVVIILYFIVLALILTAVEIGLKKNVFQVISDGKAEVVRLGFSSFREGVLILPLVVMVGFPLVVQNLLPLLIYLVVLVEMLLPFILFGEAYKFMLNSGKRLYLGVREEERETSDILENGLSALFSYPLLVFIFVAMKLEVFFNFLYLNVLWNNPDSPTAPLIWDLIEGLVGLLSFNISVLESLLDSLVPFALMFVSVALVSHLYLFVKGIIKEQLSKTVTRFIMRYD